MLCGTTEKWKLGPLARYLTKKRKKDEVRRQGCVQVLMGRVALGRGSLSLDLNRQVRCLVGVIFYISV